MEPNFEKKTLMVNFELNIENAVYISKNRIKLFKKYKINYLKYFKFFAFKVLICFVKLKTQYSFILTY